MTGFVCIFIFVMVSVLICFLQTLVEFNLGVLWGITTGAVVYIFLSMEDKKNKRRS